LIYIRIAKAIEELELPKDLMPLSSTARRARAVGIGGHSQLKEVTAEEIATVT